MGCLWGVGGEKVKEGAAAIDGGREERGAEGEHRLCSVKISGSGVERFNDALCVFYYLLLV